MHAKWQETEAARKQMCANPNNPYKALEGGRERNRPKTATSKRFSRRRKANSRCAVKGVTKPGSVIISRERTQKGSQQEAIGAF